MSKPVMYVGIDVGRTELWVSVAGCRPWSFRHSRGGIRALVAWTAQRAGTTPRHFCLEATGVYSVSVATQLRDAGQTSISIVNPVRMAAYARAQFQRSKTDQVDAAVIRAYAESQRPAVWRPAPAALPQLTALVTQADALREDLQWWRNRRQAQAFLSDLPEAVRRTQRAIERSLQTQLAKLEAAIAALCAQEHMLGQQVALLCTIPGIA
jgi:transposase